MNYAQGKRMLDEKNFLIYGTKLSHSWKKVKSMNFNYESFEKFVTKAILLHTIVRKNTKKHPIGGLTEYEFPNTKRISVLKIDEKSGEFTGFRIETGIDKKGGISELSPPKS